MNEFVRRSIGPARTVKGGSEINNMAIEKPIAKERRGPIKAELFAQKLNQAIVMFDDSTSVEICRKENDKAWAALLDWGKTEEAAELVDLKVWTVASTPVRYGPERFSTFSLDPKFRYEDGSNLGHGLKAALDDYEESRSKYKRTGLVIVHDYDLHDYPLFLEQIRRLQEIEKKYPTTFAAYPIGIGHCQLDLLKQVSSKRPGRQLSDDYSFLEASEFLKKFTQSIANGKFLDV